MTPSLRPPVLRSSGVIVVVLASVILMPPVFDDGFVTLRGLDLVSGRTTTLLDPFVRGSSNAQGVAYETIIGALAGSSIITVLRVVPAVAVILTWLMLEWWWLREIDPQSGQSSRWMAAFLTMLVAPPLAASLRPEAVVGLLLGLVLVTVNAERLVLRSGGLALLLPAGLALSIHQSGWTAIGAATVGLLSHLLRSPRRWRLRIVATVGAVATVTVGGLLFVLTPLPLSIASAERHLEFTGARGVQQGSLLVAPLSEASRYRGLLGAGLEAGSLPHLVVAVIGVAGAIVWLIASRGQRVGLTPLACVAAAGGLLLTSSKQVMHLLALLPCVAVVSVGILTTADPRRRRLSAEILAAAVSLGALFAISRRGVAGFLIPLWGFPWTAPVPEWIDGALALAMLMVAVVAVASLTMELRRIRPAGWPLTAVFFLVGLLSIAGRSLPRVFVDVSLTDPALEMTLVIAILGWLLLASLPTFSPSTDLRVMARHIGAIGMLILLGLVLLDGPTAVVTHLLEIPIDPTGITALAFEAASGLMRPLGILTIAVISILPAVSVPAGDARNDDLPAGSERSSARPIGIVALATLTSVLGFSAAPLVAIARGDMGATFGSANAESLLSGADSCGLLARLVARSNGDPGDFSGPIQGDAAVASIHPCVDRPDARRGLVPPADRIVTVTELSFLFESVPGDRYLPAQCLDLVSVTSPGVREPLIDRLCVYSRQVQVGAPDVRVSAVRPMAISWRGVVER